ncbi:MAG: MBL fold metallo-hydrolase [Myxococcales bacterium]|nr:MBL fold metallo-hydrolase [Myxococcales bacterium]USN50965.1 MAG: MBL fold metallo-hydrolase [Myxococcales bacterium]
MHITPFFEHVTCTFSYVIHDQQTKDAVIIDPVLNFDAASGKISHDSTNKLKDFIRNNKLIPQLVLDTHVHADHMTGSFFVKKLFKIKSAIGEGFLSSQDYFRKIYETDVASYELPYEHLLKNNEIINAGSIEIKALAVPGHTPSCTAYLIGNNVFSGDSLFQPNLGCGRADFPGGSAYDLFNSIKHQLYTLPDDTILWVGHDYPPTGETPKASTTILESKKHNRLIKADTKMEEFILQRENKDKTLNAPKLLLPSLQVNITGGQLPHKDQMGHRFLRIPLSIDE